MDTPTIETQPSSKFDVPEGSDVVFSVVADGYDLSYQWRKDDVNINNVDMRFEGADSTNFTVMMVNKSDEANYSCTISNRVGSVISMDAVLTVGVCVYVCDAPINQSSYIN